MAKGKIRIFFNDIHLWLGLASGIVLFLVCLSGTVYTFRTEIEERVNRKIYFVNYDAGTKPLPLSTLVTLVEKSKGVVTAVTIPATPQKAWAFSLKPQGAGKGRGKTVLVNPYTGTVTGDTETGSSKFFMTVMKLHRWLLMEQSTGRVVVGIATLIFVVLLLSGIILWLPRRLRYWKQGFVILFSGKWKRINHDLHNVLGFYSFFFLLIMALTGLCWSFDWYRNSASAMLGATVFGAKKEKPVRSQAVGTAMLSPDKVLEIGNGPLRYTGITRLGFPADSTGTFSISKNDAASWNSAATDKLIIDAYSGAVLKTDLFAAKTAGQKIAASIRPIHTGEIYGLVSKIIYFICCLIATSLPVTGTLIWLNKLKKKKPASKRTVLRARPEPAAAAV
ncbi:PepSY-associated TM helix domain-containing protein [Niabella beijingensis]|uniref:PepSY-associated TM helix domain-containing protein n=1 Tax=Niabella beijingensis TaxID=2872700 RepID=UPI001CBB042E|nr:PepSY-associated TM helix domain-containing protein [Niabella beijingensis]MBZ4187549.1 PepSY domain-containing protein [Niabella beijingensis]